MGREPATMADSDAAAVAGRFGSLMLRSDSDLPSVRRAIHQILDGYGVQGGKVRVTPWSIQLATNRGRVLYADRIKSRSRNLGRLRQLGALSRAVTSGQLRGAPLWESLQAVAVMADPYPAWLRTAAASIAAGGIALLTVSTLDVFWSVVALATATQAFASLLAPRWLKHLTAGAVAMLGALFLTRLDPGLDPRVIAAGGVVPFVPGILSESITADLLAADLISTAGRVAETVCAAAPLAAGVLLVDWLVTSK
ncbi:MAG TPA: threonine/serine exporter family protein [Symbiobacteriaceae bacterium]|nr:threonine/serine exporter family protein [Symbiobacteriaceae bacterium]